jgi:hypothetical protein
MLVFDYSSNKVVSSVSKVKSIYSFQRQPAGMQKIKPTKFSSIFHLTLLIAFA